MFPTNGGAQRLLSPFGSIMHFLGSNSHHESNGSKSREIYALLAGACSAGFIFLRLARDVTWLFRRQLEQSSRSDCWAVWDHCRILGDRNRAAVRSPG